MRLASFLCVVILGPATAAEPAARAKAELVAKEPVWVGQRVTLAITLYTPDLFAGAPAFDMPTIAGAVVVPPAGSPVIGTETIGDVSFTTQRHEFAVYAQRAETVRLPAFPVRFESSTGFGKPVTKRQVTTTAVLFIARTPPGAEGLGTVIAARNLKVTDEWKPEPKSARVGDAFTRTLTVTADDVPGIVFPSFRLDGVNGLGAYPKEPAVNDRTERGALTGQRIEAVTYVCEGAGTVTVPNRALTWYDLEANELKTVKLPGRSFTIAPDPKPEPPSPSPEPQAAHTNWWRMGAVLGVGLLLGVALLVRLGPWCVRRYAKWSRSEPADFMRLRRASRSDEPHALFIALVRWLDHSDSGSLEDFARRADDPELTRAITDLSNALYARFGASGVKYGTARDLFARVSIARRKLRVWAASPADLLPPLNPTG